MTFTVMMLMPSLINIVNSYITEGEQTHGYDTKCISFLYSVWKVDCETKGAHLFYK